MVTTREKAWKVYNDFMKKAVDITKNEIMTGKEIFDSLKNILGTHDIKQRKQLLEAMVSENWIAPLDGNNVWKRRFRVSPDGKLLSPDEKIEKMLQSLKEG